MSEHSMRRLLAFCLIIVGMAPAAQAQLIPGPPPPPAMPSDLPMHSVLYDAEQEAASKVSQPAELHRALAQRGLVVHEGRVHVEVVGPEGVEALPRVDLSRFGAVVDRGFANRIDAWVPPNQLIALARSLPPGFVLERANVPQLDDVAGEGPNTGVMNSVGYRNGNSNGNGLTIAIIDTQYSNLTAARNNGDAPTAANTTTIDYAASGAFESGGNHGTGCLEAAFDHAPGATWRLYRVDTVTDLGTAVTNCIANGVDIISHSQSWYNLGWADNAGAACAAANQASNAGIFFITSSGNRAEDHWQGNFNPGAGDANWHDWANGDEILSLVVPPSPAPPNAVSASFRLSWNTFGGTFNYDLYLYDATATNVLDSSTNAGNTFESIDWTNTGSTNVTVQLAVRRVSGGVTEFEIFGDNNSTSWEHTIAAGSNTSPSNATGSLVMSVGAVPWGSYAQVNGSTPIAGYSSQGPTNSGIMVPHIVGPTNTTGFSYPGGFGGTSCATPNVAGAFAAFWSDEAAFTSEAVNWLMRSQATVYRDWGAPGPDPVYGVGPCRVIDFVANTTWAARGYGNLANLPNAPYYHFLPAYNAAATGGRVLILGGGTFYENPTLTRAMRVESFAGEPTIGQ